MRPRRLMLLGASFLPLMMSVAPVTTAHAAEDHYITVTPQNFLTIFPLAFSDNRPISSYQFVAGPPGQPLGEGSLELQTVDVAGKQQHLERAQIGAPIRTINEMGYSTYKHQDPMLVAVAAINMEIYTTGTSGYTTLVFEPYQNGAVTPNAWQTWNAFSGNWWSTHVIPGVPLPRGVPVPWSAIVAANPNAVVISYGVNQGTFNPLTTSNVDALKIGFAGGDRWTYDFEPTCQDSGGNGNFQGQQQGNCGQRR